MKHDDDEVEIDLSEADPTAPPEPVDWDSIDFDEPEPIEWVAPWAQAATSWGEVDVASLVKGDLTEPSPDLFPRDDDARLLYRGKVHSVMGEPESGKSWFAQAACIAALADGHHAVYVDFEDTPKSVIARFLNLGVPAGLLAEKFHYIRPDTALLWKGDNKTWLDLLGTLKRASDGEGGLAILVLDGMTEALAMQSIESKDNDRVAAWFGEVPRRLAHASGAAVLLVDHVTKAEDGRGRYAIGAQAKLSALDGCQFSMSMKMQFAYGRSGVARVFVTKDRPGQVRQHAVGHGQTQVIADLVFTADTEHPGRGRITLIAPDLIVNEDGSAKPVGVQAEIVKYLRRVKGQGRGRQVILDAVKGRSEVKRRAFNEMLDEGWLVEYKEGRKIMFKLGTPQDATNNEDVT